ncbi:hypothetical protein Goshw_027659, partial [Gossypium schwendimanii]|nr:hypothetical protein [Gossypium schwendimanii]
MWFFYGNGQGQYFQGGRKSYVEGLRVAWGKGLRQVEVKCDNAFLVESLLASGSVNSRMVELRLIHGSLILNGRFTFTMFL